mmetsp:Transcript_127848/g.368174  ORF Transcript_127848/g.368174 Transcript_127848/m.368174 type:complete len:203 (-) Transcript_127848:67-675(-)
MKSDMIGQEECQSIALLDGMNSSGHLVFVDLDWGCFEQLPTWLRRLVLHDSPFAKPHFQFPLRFRPPAIHLKLLLQLLAFGEILVDQDVRSDADLPDEIVFSVFIGIEKPNMQQLSGRIVTDLHGAPLLGPLRVLAALAHHGRSRFDLAERHDAVGILLAAQFHVFEVDAPDHPDDERLLGHSFVFFIFIAPITEPLPQCTP